MTSKPSHWPPHVKYIQTSLYHSSVPVTTRLQIQSSGNPPSSQIVQHPSRKVVIRPISSMSHPASGQCGLFAAKRIPSKTHILDYIGRLKPKAGYMSADLRYQAKYTATIDQLQTMIFHFIALRMAFTWA